MYDFIYICYDLFCAEWGCMILFIFIMIYFEAEWCCMILFIFIMIYSVLNGVV